MSDPAVTLINVFTAEAANQQKLVELLARATDGWVNRAAGFISARLHRTQPGWDKGRYVRARAKYR